MLHIVGAVMTRTIGASKITVSSARFIKDEIEKGSLEKAKMNEHYSQLAEEVHEKNSKAEDGIRTTKIDSARS